MTVMQLALAYYQILPMFYWRHLYQRSVRKDALVSLESFRELYMIHRAFVFNDRVKAWQRQLLFAPLRLLGPLSDLLQSRWFEDRRLAYARNFHLFFYRQYLDYHRKSDKGINIIRVVSCESRSPITILILYHSLVDRTNMPRYAKTALHQYFHIAKEGIRTKRLDNNHLQVIFSQE